MRSTQDKTLMIATGAGPSRLSKGQKTFNDLIGRIDQRRVRLAAWEAAIPAYQQRHVGKLLPLLTAWGDLQARLVHRLEAASYDKGLTRAEQGTIAELIVELAGPLLAERDDPALKALYNKHSGSDYDSVDAAAARDAQSRLDDGADGEPGAEWDGDAADEWSDGAQPALRRGRAQRDHGGQAGEPGAAPRTKSASQRAREARQQAETQRMSNTLREVYRKLASALHPDRETDPAERLRKTALMQRVNQAYEKSNLLLLLELQLELEHIDQAAIANLGEDRLQHYIAILREQLVELDQEIRDVEGDFRARFGLAPSTAVSPGTIMRGLADDIAGVQQAIAELQTDLRAFADVRNLKVWLKSVRH